jgi:hypothetical protein
LLCGDEVDRDAGHGHCLDSGLLVHGVRHSGDPNVLRWVRSSWLPLSLLQIRQGRAMASCLLATDPALVET